MKPEIAISEFNELIRKGAVKDLPGPTPTIVFIRQIEDMVCFLEGEFESIDPDQRAHLNFDDFKRNPHDTVLRLLRRFEIPFDAKALELRG